MSKKKKNVSHSKEKKVEESLTSIKARIFFKNNKFGIYFFGIILLLVVLTLFISNNKAEEVVVNTVYGDDVIELYYFHLKTCKYCIKQNKFMKEELFVKYPNIRLNSYEMSEKGSYQKYQEMSKLYDGLEADKFPGTPLTIIGNKVNKGFGSAETSGVKIIGMVEIEMQRINANWNSSMKRTINLN